MRKGSEGKVGVKKVKTVQRWSQLSGDERGPISGDLQEHYFERILNQIVVGSDITPNPLHTLNSFRVPCIIFSESHQVSSHMCI